MSPGHAVPHRLPRPVVFLLRFPLALIPALVGVLFAALSLPDGTARLAARPGWGPLTPLARLSAGVNDSLPPAGVSLTGVVLATGCLVVATLAWTVRHREYLAGALALTVGALSAMSGHLIAWGLAAVWSLYTTVWGWLDLTWVVVICVSLGVGLSLVMSRDLSSVFWVVIMTGVWLATAAGALALAWWLSGFVLIRVLIALSLFNSLGLLVIDQFRGTLDAGRGTRGLLLGAIGSGTSLAMLMLVNGVWDTRSLYPGMAGDWINRWLAGTGEPTFDVLVALIVIGLSALATVAGVLRRRAGLSAGHFQRSLTFTVWGMVYSAAVAAVGHRTENDDDRV